MGYTRHHAIIVTIFNHVKAELAHNQANNIFGEPSIVTPIIESVCNGYCTFVVTPDGSKEFWNTSDEYDVKRSAFISWLESQKKQGNFYDWALIQYGDDEGENKIIEASR